MTTVCGKIQEQLDGVTQNSQSQQAGITAPAPGDALNAVRMLISPSELELDGKQRSLPQFSDG